MAGSAAIVIGLDPIRPALRNRGYRIAKTGEVSDFLLPSGRQRRMEGNLLGNGHTLGPTFKHTLPGQ